jgi:hypothetical protein
MSCRLTGWAGDCVQRVRIGRCTLAQARPKRGVPTAAAVYLSGTQSRHNPDEPAPAEHRLEAIAQLETHRDLTRRFYDVLSREPGVTCPYVPESNILCFRVGGIDQLAFRDRLLADGQLHIGSTTHRRRALPTARGHGARHRRGGAQQTRAIAAHVAGTGARVTPVSSVLRIRRIERDTTGTTPSASRWLLPFKKSRDSVSMTRGNHALGMSAKTLSSGRFHRIESTPANASH